MSKELEIIEDADQIKVLKSVAKKRHEELFEKHGRQLFPFDSSWTVETENILDSEIANTLANDLHNLSLMFNRIHHLQGIHELGLDPGFARVDFHGNNDIAHYQPSSMPISLEARIGPQLTYERDIPETLLPDLGAIALMNSNYFAIVGGYWGKSQRRHDHENHDTRRHFFFSARVYYNSLS